MLGGAGGVPEVPFASAYKPAEIAALWKTLKTVYGSDALARKAVSQNNQVLCPLYASPALLSQSHAALVKKLGKEEALDIQLKNPAVLTCGAAGLDASDVGEIRNAANVRQVLDKFVTPTGLVVFALTVTFLGAVAKGPAFN